ncbi:Interferon-inducible double-stranded RNA-dependent protein kinase activator A [Anthophora quadrimaculata]
MSKTPISILQEMMIQKKIIPNYELIHDGGGTHMNTFTYKVTCGDFTATGTGRSKKDAKHEAANAVLKIIVEHRGYPQLPASESPVRTPLPPPVPEVQRIPPDVPFVNAVGVLHTLCLQNNLEEPKYILISDVGPPHAKVFTIQCGVATFQEVGIARTKKQAKQEAAKKLLDKLTDIVPDTNEQISEDKSDGTSFFKDVKPLIKKYKLGIKISEYHTELQNNIDIEVKNDLITKLESLLSESHNTSVEMVQDIHSRLENILSTIGLDMLIENLEVVFPNKYAVAAKLICTPNITEIAIGNTKTEATFYVLLKAIRHLLVVLK